jgi:hypothetical protein
VLGPEVGDDEINACPFDELTDPPGIREQIGFTQIFSFDFSQLENLVRAGFHHNVPSGSRYIFFGQPGVLIKIMEARIKHDDAHGLLEP